MPRRIRPRDAEQQHPRRPCLREPLAQAHRRRDLADAELHGAVLQQRVALSSGSVDRQIAAQGRGVHDGAL